MNYVIIGLLSNQVSAFYRIICNFPGLTFISCTRYMYGTEFSSCNSSTIISKKKFKVVSLSLCPSVQLSDRCFILFISHSFLHSFIMHAHIHSFMHSFIQLLVFAFICFVICCICSLFTSFN